MTVFLNSKKTAVASLASEVLYSFSNCCRKSFSSSGLEYGVTRISVNLDRDAGLIRRGCASFSWHTVTNILVLSGKAISASEFLSAARVMSSVAAKDGVGSNKLLSLSVTDCLGRLKSSSSIILPNLAPLVTGPSLNINAGFE